MKYHYLDPAPIVVSQAQPSRLQRRAADRTGAGSSTVAPVVHDVLDSPGRPLDAATRTFMEPRLGHDFGQVRIHADARAAESARAVSAAAYTVGRDVVFGAGRYEPETSAGRRLIAHELAHTVQQGPAATAPLAIGPPTSSAEREAERVAGRVARGGPGTVSAAVGSGTLQRQEADEEERRLRLQQPGQGLGFRPPRVGLDLPRLHLDPQIAAQIRAIQFVRGLLSVENILAAAEQSDGGGAGLSLPGIPKLGPGLVPPPEPGPALPRGPLPARPPLAPPGKEPESLRAAGAGDLLKAVLKVPAVQTGVDRLRDRAISELWTKRSVGQRALIVTQGVVLGAGIIAGIASDPEAGPSRFVLGQVQDKDIPIPGLPMTFKFNLTGPDPGVLIGLDVGALLSPGSGFGPQGGGKSP